MVALTAFVALLYRGLASPTVILTDEKLWLYLRIQQYLVEFRAGNLPQLFPDAVQGGGFAFPYFYPPLSQYVAAGLVALTDNVVVGVHLALLLSVWLSGVTMAWAIRRIGGSSGAALLAAVVYVSFPYRWSDVFGRGALAECWTFVWYPILVAGAWSAWRNREVRWWLPVSGAALLLTHSVMALYFVMVLGLLLLCCPPYPSRAGKLRLACAALIAFALAAWQLLPAMAALDSVRAGNQRVMWADPTFVSSVRLAPSQVFGLTGLAAGFGPTIGVIQLALPFLAVLGPRMARPGDVRVVLGVAAVLLWMLVALFIVEPAAFFAVAPVRLAYIQFPWRCLGLTALLASLAFGLLLNGISSKLLGCAAAVIAATALVFSRPTPVTDHRLTASAVLAVSPSVGDSGYTVVAEYLPIESEPIALLKRVRSGPSVEQGARVLNWAAGVAPFADVQLSRQGNVVMPVVRYPFSQVIVDGQRAKSRSDGGLLSVSVPAGRHRIEITRSIPLPMWIGLAISLIGCGGLFLLGRFGGSKPRPIDSAGITLGTDRNTLQTG